MDVAFNEIPLVLFTTLAPLGAGAFIALAVAFFTTELSDGQLKKVDRASWLAAAVVVVGFLCSFGHLANPAHAAGVFAGLGSSPLSNEIAVGVVFVVVMLVYLILAAAGRLSGGARKGLAAVVAVAALVFALFCGMAYMISTIPSWDTPWTVLQLLGYALGGGAALGSLVLALGGALAAVAEGPGNRALAIVAIVGTVLAVVGLGGMLGAVSGMENALESGSALVAQVVPYAAAGIVCLAASCVCVAVSKAGAALPALATVLALVGIFAARLAFYALELSAGLSAV